MSMDKDREFAYFRQKKCKISMTNLPVARKLGTMMIHLVCSEKTCNACNVMQMNYNKLGHIK